MTLSSTGLCSFCDNFDIRIYAGHSCFRFGQRCEDVVSSALDGCSFCCLILDILTAPERGIYTQSFWLRRIRRQQRQRGESLSPSIIEGLKGLWERFIGRGHCINPLMIFLFTPDTENIPTSGGMGITGMHLKVPCFFGYDQATSFNVGADIDTPAWRTGDVRGALFDPCSLTVERISENITAWHAACSANHARCNQTLSRCETVDSDHTALPSRCIEVQQVQMPGGAAQGEPRFVLRETEGQSGRYLALSHRWGPEAARCRTTGANYSSRLTNGMLSPTTTLINTQTQMDTITPLFADTCALALALGIKYVWIDTLCIIQDDADDWDREGVKMATYYQQAWVTIAATVVNSAGGLFRTLGAEDMPRVARLPYRNAEGERAGFFYVQHLKGGSVSESFREMIAESQLRTRGWVLQESLLSPRVVSFSSTGIFVECRSERPKPGAALGDTSIIHDDYRTQVQILTSQIPQSLIPYQGEVLSASPKHLHESWYSLVSRYAALDLTQIHKDRLMALAGIANEFGLAIAAMERKREESRTRQQRDEEERVVPSPDNLSLCYASGLWMSDMAQGLLWEQVEPGPYIRAEALPTWSWASILSLKRNEAGDEVLTGWKVDWFIPGPQTHFTTPLSAVLLPLISVENAVVVPVTADVHGHQKARFDLPTTNLRASATAEDRRQEYGNRNRFVALALRGKLLRVDSITDNGDNRNEWPSQTDQYHCRRYSVRLAEGGGPSGYASFEHPQYQTDRPGSTYALIIAREKEIRSTRAPTYSVLYIREVETAELFRPSYERVGTGKIWKRQLHIGFPAVEEKRLWLV